MRQHASRNISWFCNIRGAYVSTNSHQGCCLCRTWRRIVIWPKTNKKVLRLIVSTKDEDVDCEENRSSNRTAAVSMNGASGGPGEGKCASVRWWITRDSLGSKHDKDYLTSMTSSASEHTAPVEVISASHSPHTMDINHWFFHMTFPLHHDKPDQLRVWLLNLTLIKPKKKSINHT